MATPAAALRTYVLGEFAVGADDAVPIVPRGMPAEILALLALEPGHAVPTARIIDHIWAPDPPDGAAARLHVHVSRLRRTLARLGCDRIDLYQIHRPDLLAHPQEVARALDDARSAGKIVAIGVSNHTVAQTEAGVSCLLVPRQLPDGTLNNIRINRLKDKLGNRANASSEIEYHDAVGYLVGEEGKGIRTILSSAEYTRLDFAV